MEQHFTECDYVPVKCKNQGCQETVKRCDEEEHTKICPFQKIRCKLCELGYLRNDTESHFEICLEAQIPCDKCEIPIKRKDKAAHDCLKTLKEQNRILQREKQESQANV